MSHKILVKNKRYTGKYVAMPSFNERKVIASGKDPHAVIDRAKQKGYEYPVVIFVPAKGCPNIYLISY